MSMKTKIAALIAKANSSTHPEEQDTFIQKARELMERHQIDSVDVELGADASTPIGTIQTKSFEIGSPAGVKYMLEAWIAEFFGCQCIILRSGKRGYIDIHGSEAALATHQAMFPFVWKQVLEMARTHGSTPNEQRKLQREIAYALGARVRRMADEAERARHQEATAGSKNALVLVSIEDQVDAYVQSRYSTPIQTKTATKKKMPGYLARSLAEQVSLSQQVGGEGKTKALV